jgi:putative phosphoesterase
MASTLHAHRSGEQVVARVGLISDTHMPERNAAFPASLPDVLHGVDLILHAGDVGELWVLDRLSAIAPVVAVHGNDDTPNAQRELPYQQLIAIVGQRVLLWHSHYPDPAEERARRADPWQAMLARRAERGRASGASIVVYRHAHVPMARVVEGVLLVNPGALASGGWITRQTRQTVALLSIPTEGTPQAQHVDLSAPGQAHVPRIDWDAPFRAAFLAYQAHIVDERLREDVSAMWRHVSDANIEALRETFLPLSHRCWSGEQPRITRSELIEGIVENPVLSVAEKDRFLGILGRTGSQE